MLDTTKKLLNMNEVNNVQNRKSVANLLHFYTLTTNYQNRNKEIIPFTITSKKIKYLGIYLTGEAWDLYNKSIRYWWKKLKETQINGKIYPAHSWKNEYYLNVHITQRAMGNMRSLVCLFTFMYTLYMSYLYFWKVISKLRPQKERSVATISFRPQRKLAKTKFLLQLQTSSFCIYN